MATLRNSANSVAKLSKYIDVKAISYVMTRWSSKFEMVERYFELHPILCQNSIEFNVEPLTARELMEVKNLEATLKNFHDCTLELQKDWVTLADVFAVCTKLCEDYPSLKSHLDPEDFSDFETAIIDSMNGAKLTKAQKEILRPFEDVEEEEDEEEEPNKKQRTNYASDAKKSFHQRQTKYISFNFINPTSVCVERLFSIAGYVFDNVRKSMSNAHLEWLLMLKLNPHHWPVHVIDRAMH
eukprot:gene14956-16650_t